MAHETRDLEEALKVYENPGDPTVAGIHFTREWKGSAYIELAVMKDPNTDKDVEDLSVYKVRKNPDYRPSTDNDDDWRREIAMQAGMGGGCAAYNEVMGY
jgi:hypothetical protein